MTPALTSRASKAGLMGENSAGKDTMDGSAWERFCDTLKMAGMVVMRDSAPDSALDRAEGYRYLSRLTRAGLEAFVERADPLPRCCFGPLTRR